MLSSNERYLLEALAGEFIQSKAAKLWHYVRQVHLPGVKFPEGKAVRIKFEFVDEKETQPEENDGN
jgi:hypothetical protein